MTVELAKHERATQRLCAAAFEGSEYSPKCLFWRVSIVEPLRWMAGNGAAPEHNPTASYGFYDWIWLSVSPSSLSQTSQNSIGEERSLRLAVCFYFFSLPIAEVILSFFNQRGLRLALCFLFYHSSVSGGLKRQNQV